MGRSKLSRLSRTIRIPPPARVVPPGQCCSEPARVPVSLERSEPGHDSVVSCPPPSGFTIHLRRPQRGGAAAPLGSACHRLCLCIVVPGMPVPALGAPFLPSDRRVSVVVGRWASGVQSTAPLRLEGVNCVNERGHSLADRWLDVLLRVGQTRRSVTDEACTNGDLTRSPSYRL